MAKKLYQPQKVVYVNSSPDGSAKLNLETELARLAGTMQRVNATRVLIRGKVDFRATVEARANSSQGFLRAYTHFSRLHRDSVRQERISYRLDRRTNQVTLLIRGKPYDPNQKYFS